MRQRSFATSIERKIACSAGFFAQTAPFKKKIVTEEDGAYVLVVSDRGIEVQHGNHRQHLLLLIAGEFSNGAPFSKDFQQNTIFIVFAVCCFRYVGQFLYYDVRRVEFDLVVFSMCDSIPTCCTGANWVFLPQIAIISQITFAKD